jgi:CxxC-x17-CxxC domain-containing protein
MYKREIHKAVCAECKRECEVPFKPDQANQSTVASATQKEDQQGTRLEYTT